MDFESKLIVGISRIAGWGLFSNELIKKDSLIGEYKGELITDEIVNKRDKYREYENCTYMFKLDDEYTIDSKKMGNLLRYANHSKANSNSYTKIVFSEGQRKIVLIAKRDILKGEEILFDYDGQGILGKQFTWINDEKKITKNENNINNKDKNNNNHKNSVIKKEPINKRLHSHSAIKSTTTVINIVEDEDENENEINANKDSDKKDIVINPCSNNLNNNINIINNNNETHKENNNNEIKIKNDINIEKLKKDDTVKKEISNISIDKYPTSKINNEPLQENIDNNDNNNNNKKTKNNLIDLLSDGNYNFKQININSANNINTSKNANNNQKIIFKTEEDDIINLRSNFKKGNETNIFNLMSKIGENLERNNKLSNSNKLLNKKRTSSKSGENKFETELNFNINYNINKDSDNISINKNNNSLKQVFINNENQPQLNFEISNRENNLKLRKPIFVGENLEESIEKENNTEKNNFYINNKIRYNFITCHNFNIFDSSKNQQENEINQINNVINNTTNIFNQNNFANTKKNNSNINLGLNQDNGKNKTKNIKDYYLGTIRVILELDNNPILNDFKFYSTTNSDILNKIERIKCKTLNLNNFPIDVDLDKDIYGFLTNSISNKGFRIFIDYLSYYENMCYYCSVNEINANVYIITKGPVFNKIKEKIDYKVTKFKRLLFFIKKKA